MPGDPEEQRLLQQAMNDVADIPMLIQAHLIPGDPFRPATVAQLNAVIQILNAVTMVINGLTMATQYTMTRIEPE